MDDAIAGVREHELRDGTLAVVREVTPVSPATRVAAEAHARRYAELRDAPDVRVERAAAPRITRRASAGA